MPKTKQQKREEAAERQEKYSAMPVVERLAALPKHGVSEKERARLEKMLASAESKSPAASAPASVPKGFKRTPDGSLKPKAK